MRVVVATGRYGGQRFGWMPDPEVFRPTERQPAPADESGVSERARSLGLHTLADVARERRAAKVGWSKGRDYHCPACNRDFWSVSTAQRHERATSHVVLRMDFEADATP